MKPSISRKMDMVKDVFLKQKKLEEDITFAEFVVNNREYYDEFYEDDYPQLQLLVEGNSNRKVSTRKNKISNKKSKISNSRKCRIKNNKGEYVDIKKVKQDDTSLLELPPPEDDSQLIQIGNQNTIPENIRLLEKVKNGKKRFVDFQKQSEKICGGDYYRNNEIEYHKPKLVRKEVEEILF